MPHKLWSWMVGRSDARKDLIDQWQVAMIWMQDVNKARYEKRPYGLLTRLSARNIAEYQLDKFFKMVDDYGHS